MNNLKVRHARPEDDFAVGELLVRAFVAAYGLKKPEFVVGEERQQTLRDVGRRRGQALVLVEELDGRLVGTASLYRPGSEECRAWLEGYCEMRYLATDPEVHGQGFGPALLEALDREAAGWGAKGICIHIRRGLPGLERFYQSHGYRRDESGDKDHGGTLYLQGFFKALASTGG